MTATGQDADLSFGDILETLDFALMGGLEARNGRWSFLGTSSIWSFRRI
ncbi:MAG: hypothetical protein JKP98_23670 [Rhodobacteraceae bacterium]|nr:hypothetical protein [Paracoccaceae bacterium]